MRRPAVKQKPADLKTFPAPVHGWIANVNLATPGGRWRDGSTLMGAAMLDNWFPTATGIRMRGGSLKHATVGAETSNVTAIFSYDSGAVEYLFCADAAGIYDITTPSDPDTAIVAEVGSLTSGEWKFVQFSTTGGDFLRGVNGTDTPLVFDGTNWGTSPAITGVTPEALSHIWAYKERLWFVEKDTLNAWYLPVGTIGGTATKFPLGGVFTRGGSLLFGASWSLDSDGLSEQCAFVSTEGEVAIFQGDDPADAATWRKVGTYRIGRPLGGSGHIRAGGDLVIATDVGFVPLSSAVQRDYAALAPNAVSYPIEVEWNQTVSERSTGHWHCEVWPTRQMAVVAVHGNDGEEAMMFVANVRTGAWGRYTGWQGYCVHVYKERFFYGAANGVVVEGEVTGSDQEQPYTATCVPLFDPLKSGAALKVGVMARATLRAPIAPIVKMALQTDYVVNLPVSPDQAVSDPGSVWGAGLWGTAVWSSPPQKQTVQEWQSLAGAGYALSVSVQITSGGISPPEVELVQTDLLYDRGAIVT